MTRLTLLMSGAAVLGACTPPAISLPKDGNVHAIDVSPGDHRIEDRERIGRVMRFVRARNDRWERPSIGTYPTPQCTASFHATDKRAFVLWIGPSWIGGRGAGETAGDSRIQTAKGAELRELISLLELPAGACGTGAP